MQISIDKNISDVLKDLIVAIVVVVIVYLFATFFYNIQKNWQEQEILRFENCYVETDYYITNSGEHRVKDETKYCTKKENT